MKHLAPMSLIIALFLAVAAALSAVGCSSAAPAGQPTPTTAPRPASAMPTPPPVGKALVVALLFISQPTDPARGGFHPMQTGVAETLFKLDKDLKAQPWLATTACQRT